MIQPEPTEITENFQSTAAITFVFITKQLKVAKMFKFSEHNATDYSLKSTAGNIPCLDGNGIASNNR
jgi:hypothetical protein